VPGTFAGPARTSGPDQVGPDAGSVDAGRADRPPPVCRGDRVAPRAAAPAADGWAGARWSLRPRRDRRRRVPPAPGHAAPGRAPGTYQHSKLTRIDPPSGPEKPGKIPW